MFVLKTGTIYKDGEFIGSDDPRHAGILRESGIEVNSQTLDVRTISAAVDTNKRQGGEVGLEFPNLGEFYESPTLDVEDVRKAAFTPVINATLRKLEKFIFEGAELLAVPPDEIANTVGKEELQQVQTMVEEIDKAAMRTCLRVRQAWKGKKVYGCQLFERINGSIKGLKGSYKGPVVFKRLPMYSFNEQPGDTIDSSKYVAGSLLKGVVYDMDKQEYRYFQKRKEMEQPTELKSDNIVNVRDETAEMPDGESVVATLVPLVRKMNFADKALMQWVNRAGAPVLDVRVAENRMEPAALNQDAWSFPQAFSESKKIAKNWGKDTVMVHPDCISVEPLSWSDGGISPIEVVNFLNERILYALIPRDFTENKGIAISNTGTTSLDMLNLWARGEQHEIEEPFLREWDTILEQNGKEGWRVEIVWREMTPDSGDQLFTRMRIARDVGVFTPDEMRELVGYPPLTDDQRVEIAKIPAKGNNPGDKVDFSSEEGGEDGVGEFEGEEDGEKVEKKDGVKEPKVKRKENVT